MEVRALNNLLSYYTEMIFSRAGSPKWDLTLFKKLL